MSRNTKHHFPKSPRKPFPKRDRSLVRRRSRRSRPVAAYRQRGASESIQSEHFNAPEIWHEPTENGQLQIITHPAGAGYIHPVTPDEVRQRIEELPSKWTRELEVVQFSPMTRKRALFPCYGMQWGATVYLYPIEESLTETYVRPPRPEQLIEAKMYGGQWRQEGHLWMLEWTPETIRDFYLNNVLIHEIGHINDHRNTNFDDRERYANWFAIEYGYRPTRHLRVS
ncbi:MAG: hypothetical protein Tsb009_26750 [Planctomycetaceae bacterium]